MDKDIIEAARYQYRMGDPPFEGPDGGLPIRQKTHPIWDCPVCRREMDSSLKRNIRNTPRTVECAHCGLKWERFEDLSLTAQEVWWFVKGFSRLDVLGGPS